MKRKVLQDIAASTHRLDAAESIYVGRQLEQIRVNTYDTKYPNLMARQLAPVDSSIHPGAEIVTYKQYSLVGMAIIISNYSDRLPRADTFVKEFSAKIRGIGTSYGFSVQEMRAAQFAGQPLEQRKANAARRAFEERLDKIVQTGDSEHGLLGMLNQTNTTAFTVPNGAGGQPTFASKTPDEVLKDLNGIVNGIFNSTKQLERPTRLLLPTAQFTDISTRARSSTSDTTILDFFIKNQRAAGNPIEVMPWWALAGAGASSTDRMVAYTPDPDHLQILLPLDFSQLPPQWEGLELVTDCEGRCGGVVVYYPLSMSYGDGI